MDLNLKPHMEALDRALDDIIKQANKIANEAGVSFYAYKTAIVLEKTVVPPAKVGPDISHLIRNGMHVAYLEDGVYYKARVEAGVFLLNGKIINEWRICPIYANGANYDSILYEGPLFELK